MPTQTLIKESFLGDDKTTTADWVQDGDLPDIEPYFQLMNAGAEEGPWIVLDGLVHQENKDLQRETFFYVRSFIVSANDKDEILDFLSKQVMGGRWLPEKFDFSGTYFAEVPWCSSFPDDSACDLSFEIGEKVSTQERQKVEFVKDDQGFSIIKHDEIEEYEVTEKQYKTFQAIMPVCDMRQNITDGETGSAQSLTKKLTADLELIGQPQTFDLFTKCGAKANTMFLTKEKVIKIITLCII